MPNARSQRATLYYEVGGEGSALVFAHGAGGNRMIWWQQTPYFEERYRVVRFDHRAFGRSACAPDDFHPRHFADDLIAILDEEGIEQAALVCQSMGGWTGLQTATRHPERVSCLVLCGTPGGVACPEVLEAAASLGKRIGTEGIRGNAALAPDFPEREPALAQLYDQISALNTGVEPSFLGRLFDEDARITASDLAGFSIPTMMVLGEQDLLFPPEALRAVARLIPGSQVREFPGAGHSVYFEQPAAFNAAVGEFIAQHTGN